MTEPSPGTFLLEYDLTGLGASKIGGLTIYSATSCATSEFLNNPLFASVTNPYTAISFASDAFGAAKGQVSIEAGLQFSTMLGSAIVVHGTTGCGVFEVSDCTADVVNFGTECNYECDASLGFELKKDSTRVCGQSGAFSGDAGICGCKAGLILDPISKECVSTCPTGLTAPFCFCCQLLPVLAQLRELRAAA